MGNSTNPIQTQPRRFIPMLASLLVLIGALAACTADVKHQTCKVDDDCKADLGDTAYCMHARCVECVSHASCKHGKRCVDGMCERPEVAKLTKTNW